MREPFWTQEGALVWVEDMGEETGCRGTQGAETEMGETDR